MTEAPERARTAGRRYLDQRLRLHHLRAVDATQTHRSLLNEMLHGTDLISIMPRLMMARARDLPPAGHAFIACLRAYVVELAERGIADAIASGDSGEGRSDTTKARRKR